MHEDALDRVPYHTFQKICRKTASLSHLLVFSLIYVLFYDTHKPAILQIHLGEVNVVTITVYMDLFIPQ